MVVVGIRTTICCPLQRVYGAVLKPRRETVNLLLDAVTHTAPTAGRNVHGVMALMRLLTLDHCRP